MVPTASVVDPVIAGTAGHGWNDRGLCRTVRALRCSRAVARPGGLSCGPGRLVIDRAHYPRGRPGSGCPRSQALLMRGPRLRDKVSTAPCEPHTANVPTDVVMTTVLPLNIRAG